MRRRVMILVAVATVALAAGTVSAPADHNFCHNEGTPPDVWTGIVGADTNPNPGFGVCLGYFIIWINVHPGNQTVTVATCDASESPITCDQIVGPTGDVQAGPGMGPACLRAEATVNGTRIGPFNIGVCSP